MADPCIYLSPMDDIRWFAPNRFCTLPVGPLRPRAFRISTEGTREARLAFAADGASAVEAFRYAAPRGIPLVVYLWDLPPWQLAGGPDLVLGVGGRLIKIPRVLGRYPERNGYHSRVRYIARRAREVWVPSINTQQDVGHHFGVDSRLVPFCIDSDRFNRDAGWQPPPPPTVLCISRLVDYKNHAAVIRAAALVSPVPRVRIIGRGPEAANLHALATSLGVPLHLEEEWQSDDEILAAYLDASVVVSASRFEGFGLTPLEAIALGIPTVASDIPPHREFCGGFATLVPLDDDAAMARALSGALHNPAVFVGVTRDPLRSLTIEACAERIDVRFEDLLTEP